jgi:hypothetical protein
MFADDGARPNYGDDGELAIVRHVGTPERCRLLPRAPASATARAGVGNRTRRRRQPHAPVPFWALRREFVDRLRRPHFAIRPGLFGVDDAHSPKRVCALVNSRGLEQI